MRNELLMMLGGLFSSSGSGEKGVVQKRVVETDSSKYDYQVYLSPKVQNENDLPVIVFLHGIRERGTGGFLPTEGALGKVVLHYFSQVPAIILLPQCRPGKYWSDPEMDEMVMRAIAQTVEEFRADGKRIYLIGVSMGGYGVWHFASQYPRDFAALVPICGGSPLRNGNRFESIAEKVGKTPTWLFHGADDSIVPVSESREMTKALKANSGNVKYSEYAGVGHNVWLNVLSERELFSWILGQRGE